MIAANTTKLKTGGTSHFKESPEYLLAYDFLASVHEAKGNLAAAQQVLQSAADASPHNTVRQRLVGDIAARNKDFLTAENLLQR